MEELTYGAGEAGDALLIEQQHHPPGEVSFRWLSLRRGGRAVPVVAVVGREISAQFVFANRTNRPIDRLEITVVADPLCEYDICECSEDRFRRDIQFESRLWGLFRKTTDITRIIYDHETIGAQEEITGWMRVNFRKLGGESYRPAGLAADFKPVSLTLRANYGFEGETSTRTRTLSAEEVTFIHKGSMPARIKRKLGEEWIELLVVSVFAWVIGLLSPQLLRMLVSLWYMILNALR